MTLRSLPTTLTTAALDGLLAKFPKNAKVSRLDDSATVHAPNGAKVVSSVMIRPNRWHVMAAPGLLIPVPQDERVAADLARNDAKNTGKLQRDEVDRAHRVEVAEGVHS